MPAPEGFFDGQQVADTVTADFKQQLNRINARKQELDKYIETGLPNDITNLNSIFAEYVKSGGVKNAVVAPGPNNSPPSGAAPTVDDMIQKITTNMKKYRNDVNDELQKLRRNVLQSSDVNSLSSKLSNKAAHIDEMKKKLEEENNNLSTAYTRNAMLETKDQAISYQQTWGFLQRPLRKWSIPVLIITILVFVLLSFVGVLLMLPGVQEMAALTNSGIIAGAPIPDSMKSIAMGAHSTIFNKIIDFAKSTIVTKLLLAIKPLLAILPFAII